MRTDLRPADAWRDDEDREWVHGAKDAEGRLVGEVRYWNDDGVLISTVEHVAGKPHGAACRYYSNGEIARDARYVDGVIESCRYLRPSDDEIDAVAPLASMDDTVAVCTCTYESGDMISMQCFDSEGREVGEHGEPMPKRPAGVRPEAYHRKGHGWFWARRGGENGIGRIEGCEWFDNGVLRQEHDHRTGIERGFYQNGRPHYEGQRVHVGTSYRMTGTWRYFDAKGRLARVSEYVDGTEVRRAWHRPAREAKRAGIVREGAIENDLEVGVWVVRDAKDATIAELDLGPPRTDAELLGHAVAADMLDDAYQPAANDRSLTAMIAAIRRAGIARDPNLMKLDSGPAWRAIDDKGKPVSLAKPSDRSTLISLVHALRWGPPDPALLAGIAAALFRGNRAVAALDVIDAARELGDGPQWRTDRATYLRALGRSEEAARMTARPHGLDDSALALLAEIRANPDDDAPRMVFADHIAAACPEHTALIVAQCAKQPANEPLRAFLATLPQWLRKYPAKLVRGFFDTIHYIHAEHFVNGDPDLLYRVAPTCDQLGLQYASGHVAALVTMPALRRYRELSFSDTYLFNGQAAQLAACPHLEQLEDLGLYATSLHDEDLLAILQSTAYPRLQSLDISNGREEQDYTIASLRALPDAVFAPSLRVLHMSRVWLGDEVVEIIARLPALVDLDLTSNGLSETAALALAQLPHTFTSLTLHANRWSATACGALRQRFGDVVRF